MNSTTSTTTPHTSATPRLGSLVIGTVFLAVGVGTLAGAALDLDLGAIAAGALIVGGLTVIAARIVGARRSGLNTDVDSDDEVDPDTSDDFADLGLDDSFDDPDAIADLPLQ